eukprot:CAMPEP_0171457448 /NCGR_PEP_ID=MMETSP0945-20130129/3531_1 /TAXON_ID=109269 /ORGANISM="Vaucheria litorea, Strain CCMP2940" /LENGTH=416 /DNA_ID=CAMNT_0011983075 /DNA_START=100 /DNA_END=1350 /DNA_ORIENTATION=+
MSTTHLVPGLLNFGNACFLNSVLQSLASLKKFVRYLKEIQTPTHQPCFSATLLSCLDGLKDGRTGYRTAQEVYDGIVNKVPQFKGNDQQDAQEVCSAMMNLVESDRDLIKGQKPVTFVELPSQKKINKSRYQMPELMLRTVPNVSVGGGLEQLLTVPAILPKYFSKLPMRGAICSTLRCAICNTAKSPEISSFHDISLPFPQHEDSCGMNPSWRNFGMNGTGIGTGVPSFNLQDCLREFSRKEVVEGVKCDFCTEVKRSSKGQMNLLNGSNGFESRHGPALKKFYKRLTLTRMPPVLCLHLCRRQFNASQNRFVKLNHQVSFPFVLSNKELSCCCQSDQILSSNCHYVLCAVIVHIGSAESGHYVAYRKISGGKWVFASDTQVRSASEDEVQRSNAYMLFYEMNKIFEARGIVNGK